MIRREIDESTEAVRAVVTAALDRLTAAGWELVDVDWPPGDDIASISTTVLLGEFARAHADERPDLDSRVGPDILARLDADRRPLRRVLGDQFLEARMRFGRWRDMRMHLLDDEPEEQHE